MRHILLAAGSILLVLLVLELGLRASSYRRTPADGTFHTEKWAAPDPELGWRMAPGVWKVDILSKPMTVLADGSRLVPALDGGQEAAQDAPVVLLLGGSYMLGYGVEDGETIAAVLQKELTARGESLRVINMAVPGYGTWQSYLLLRRYLAEHAPPAVVVYGYAGHHAIRNIRAYDWIRSLVSYKGVHMVPPHLERSTNGEWIARPYSEVNFAGLADDIDLVYFIQDRLLRLIMDENRGDAAAATCYSMARIDALCRERGSRFIAVNVFGKDPECETPPCAEYASCALPVRFQDPEWFLTSGDIVSGHPNADHHSSLAGCIARMISSRSFAQNRKQ